MCQIGLLFPKHLRAMLQSGEWLAGLEEIRVRIGQPMEFSYSAGEKYLALDKKRAVFFGTEALREKRQELYPVTGADIAEMLNYISNYSLYAFQEEMKQGYITIEGGHRIGMAGQAAILDGKLTGIYHVSFLNIRIAHEKKGCAAAMVPYIREKESIYNTLILSPPGAGKTTLLRDSIRILSEGEERQYGIKVCVVDERSEIAACYHGMPQNDLGPRTDVLDGCGKAEGIQMLIRTMSPQVVAVDELGTEEDFCAVEQAINSGSRILGTIHAGNIQELSEKPFLKKWMKKGMFKRFVLIERNVNGRMVTVYDQNMEQIC